MRALSRTGQRFGIFGGTQWFLLATVVMAALGLAACESCTTEPGGLDGWVESAEKVETAGEAMGDLPTLGDLADAPAALEVFDGSGKSGDADSDSPSTPDLPDSVEAVDLALDAEIVPCEPVCALCGGVDGCGGTCNSDDLCDDGNACTTGTCHPEDGCLFEPKVGQCNDDNFCTVDDQCQLGLCVGTPKDCSDQGVGDCPGLCNPATGECVPNLDLGSNEECDGLDNDCDGMIDEVACGVCEPCADDTACETGVCGKVPPVTGLDDEYCSLNDSWCVYINPFNGLCETVQQGESACATLTQACLCGPGSWFCDGIPECQGLTPMCVDGKCVACEPFTEFCDGDTIMVCAADGSQWVLTGVCGEGSTCLCDSACIPSDEFEVSTGNLSLLSANINPRVARRAGGGFAVVFPGHEAPGGDGWDIFVRLYDDLAQPGTPQMIMVNTVTEGTQEAPDIAGFPTETGGFIIVWEDDDGPLPDAEGTYIVGQLLNNDGGAVGGALPINQAGEGEQSNPAVAGLYNGTFVVIWEHESLGEPESPEVIGQLLNSDAEAVGAAFQVNEWIAGAQTLPAIAHRGQDGFVASWTSVGQVDNFGVFGKLYSKNAVPITLEFPVSAFTSGTQKRSSVAGFAGDKSGESAFTWESINQDGSSTGVYMRLFDKDAVGFPGNADLPVNKKVKAGAQRDPEIAVLDNNTVIVVWETPNFVEGDATFEEVVAKAFDDDGTEYFEDEILVNTTTEGKQHNPHAAALGDCLYVVVWTHSPGTNGHHVFARLLGANY